MALGDYVATFAGAVAGGARAIVASILQRGGPGTEAGAALRQTFPSLPGNIIGSLVSQVQRGLASGQTAFGGSARMGIPALTIQPIGKQPTARQAVIRATVTGSDGSESISTHVVDLQQHQTLADAQAEVMKRLNSIFEDGKSPDVEEQLEGEDAVDVETEVLEVRERAGG